MKMRIKHLPGRTTDPALGLLIRLVQVLGLVPRPVAESISRFLGNLAFCLARRHRAIAIGNLTIAFSAELSPGQIRSLARRVFQNLCRMAFEIGWALRLKPSDVHRWFSIEGGEHFHAAFREGRGVLFLLCHMGNWELLSVIASLMGHPINIAFRPLDNPLLDRLLRYLRFHRGTTGIPTHPRADKAMARVIRCLRNGEGVGLLMDQNVDWYEGVFVDFFGQRACTSRSLAMISLRTGAPVIPCVIESRGGKFIGRFAPALPRIDTGDKRRDIEDATQLYNQVIEAAVRRRPDQWFWVHQRWKTKPFCRLPRAMDPANGEILV